VTEATVPPDSKFLVGLVGGAAAVFVPGGLATRLIAREESTTTLDAYDTVPVDGHQALGSQDLS
jgi:hypothetical protein